MTASPSLFRSVRRLALVSAIIGGSVVLHQSVQAGYPETFERVERLLGVGWGDGYQACRSSGIRPLADCPPRTYASQNNSPLQRMRGCESGKLARSFYDVFDNQCDRLGGCDGLSGGVGGTVAPMFAKSPQACDACDGSTPINWDALPSTAGPSIVRDANAAPMHAPVPQQPPAPRTVLESPATSGTDAVSPSSADPSSADPSNTDGSEDLLIDDSTSEGPVDSPSDIAPTPVAPADEGVSKNVSATASSDGDASDIKSSDTATDLLLPKRLDSPTTLTRRSQIQVGQDLPMQIHGEWPSESNTPPVVNEFITPDKDSANSNQTPDFDRADPNSEIQRLEDEMRSDTTNDLDSLLNEIESLGRVQSQPQVKRLPSPQTTQTSDPSPAVSPTIIRLPTTTSPGFEDTSRLDGTATSESTRIARLPERLPQQSATQPPSVSDPRPTKLPAAKRVFRDVPANLIIRQPR